MKYSIIIPLYNNRYVVERAVRSVLAQSFRDFEVIVVDDGSTDGGADSLNGMCEERLSIVRQDNQGAAAARNRGISESHGHWIGFLDADDEWMPTMLAAVEHALAAEPTADLCFTQYVRDRNLMYVSSHFPRHVPRVVDDYFSDHLAKGVRIWTGVVFLRQDLLKQIGLFDCSLLKAQDRDQWDRALFAARHSVYLPEVHAIYHTADSKSVERHLAKVGTTVAWDYFKKRDEYVVQQMVPPTLLRSYLRYMDDSVLGHVRQRATEGHRIEAGIYLLRLYRGSWLPKQVLSTLAVILLGTRLSRQVSTLVRRACS